MYDKGTNEYADEEDGRPYQPPEVDVDAINDEMWLRKKEEEEKEKQQQIIESCCQLGNAK